MNARVTYLLNSGFAVELEDCLLVFDYYLDPGDYLSSIIDKYDKVYFFVSHRHFDHFNPEISKFKKNVTYFILSYDINNYVLPANKVIIMEEYSKIKIDEMVIDSFSSTDEGISFCVNIFDKKIFHAGDFNWWHWKGDTENNILFARNRFKKQMKYFQNKTFDLVFFPVDSRLEEFMDLGLINFAKEVKIQNLVTMHNVGGKKWNVPNIPEINSIKNIFIPVNNGDCFDIVV